MMPHASWRGPASYHITVPCYPVSRSCPSSLALFIVLVKKNRSKSQLPLGHSVGRRMQEKFWREKYIVCYLACVPIWVLTLVF